MSKQALVINKEELLKLQHIPLNENTIQFTNPTDILNANFTLMSRDTCETDESVVQILPYITLIDIESREIFTYRRGSAGDENRLHSKTSIGLGGHVEEQPLILYNICNKLSNVAGILAMNMIRELNEEVGINITYNLLDEIQRNLLSGDFRLFYSEQDQVAKHHLCLHYILYVLKKDLTSLEEGHIVDPCWVSIKDLILDNDTNLEGWSQICIDFVERELG